jgi:hypothetical protein
MERGRKLNLMHMYVYVKQGKAEGELLFHKSSSVCGVYEERTIYSISLYTYTQIII